MHALIFRANPNYRRHSNHALHNYRKLQYEFPITQNMSTSGMHQDHFPTVNYDLHVAIQNVQVLLQAFTYINLVAVAKRDNSARKIS